MLQFWCLIYSETNRTLVLNFTYAHIKKRGGKACTEKKIKLDNTY